MEVVSKDLDLNTRFFKINGVRYCIVGTILNLGTLDTVINLENGRTKRYSRFDLKEMTDKFKAEA